MKDVIELKEYVGTEVSITDKKGITHKLKVAEVTRGGVRLLEPTSGLSAKITSERLKELIEKKRAKESKAIAQS